MKHISKIQYYCVISVIFLLLLNCKKKEEYSVIPYIEYLDFVKSYNTDNQETATLKIYFTDGDGDIGIATEDSLPAPYNKNNLFLSFYKKENGVFNEIVFSDYGFEYKIPDITIEGEDKNIRGEIDVALSWYIISPFLQNDTILIKTYIVDKASHVSNTIQTPEIIVSQF